MILCSVFVLVTVVWYLLRGLSRWWGPAGRAVDFGRPYTRFVHRWALAAPATFTYIVVFSSSTLLQRTGPPDLIDVLTTMQSTNLVRLSASPLVVLADSALWVSDRGAFLAFYVFVYATVVAWGEQRYGTPRIILIGLCGHVLGSLLTALVEYHAITNGLAPARLAFTTDVGVSYIMVAGVAAAVILMRGRWRATGVIALAVGVGAPVVFTGTIWNLGHLLATMCGLAAAVICLRIAPPRTPPAFDLRRWGMSPSVTE
ncbi:rhomboid-like protein [Herbidospora mongoliensis]|uniref:rhomboid-like protein n=1 Tax=Herbidospora mongoliensis TaxID=688067 RepID=UPI000831DD8D|nr:rhomboid-like protein [Herbidospora mongoliensis]